MSIARSLLPVAWDALQVHKPPLLIDEVQHAPELFTALKLHIDRRLVRAFGVLDRAPLRVGPGAVLCMAERFSAFDRNNLIVPVWML